MNNKLTSLVRYVVIAGLLLALVIPSQLNVLAAANLTITPITWNIMGLDSNNVNVGPNHFPVGVRVCNTGDSAATNVTSVFVWDTSDPYINLRAGTLTSFTGSNAIASLAPNACTDFYYEVAITRNSSAYDHIRRYHITTSADGLSTVSTATPREIYVEHLVSQNRNTVSDVQLDGVSIPSGGTMTLMVGQSYTIKLVGSTATQGYEQIESFINFPNTVFQVQSVITTYSAETSTILTPPYDKLYGDACTWENDPNSPNYRACNGSGKAGGNVTVTYQVRILSVGSTGTENLSTLLYDFSGSSFHYNSDYGTSTRFATIIDPSATSIAKTFLPDTIAPSGKSTLVLTISNPTSMTISGINFIDTFPTSPANMIVATPTNASTVGCGSPTFAPTAGDAAISFSNGSIVPSGNCVIKVDVTVPTAGTYANTTGRLFINTNLDTGKTASANLTATTSTQSCTTETMAQWTIPATSVNPPDTAGGVPTVRASNVASAVVSASIPVDTTINTTSGSNDTYSWGTWGYKNNGQSANFVLDTSKYTNVSMSFYARKDSNGPTTMTVNYNKGLGLTPIASYTAATTPSLSTAWTQYTVDFTGNTSATTTTFQVTGTGALNDQSGANLFIDNITFTGTRCVTAATPPTISKAFSPDPIPLNGITTLTFTVANTSPSNVALTNVTFTDDLPTGLKVASTPNASTTCTGASFNPLADSVSLTLSLPTMSQNATCTAQVDIIATTPGYRENVSGYISSTESGMNKTTSGYATDSLTVIAPPSLTKSFSPTPIQTGSTSVLTFTITNPNASTNLNDIAFTDALPTGVTIVDSSSTQCSGTLIATGPDTITFSGGTLNANSSCTFNVTVTGATAGAKNNVTSVISSTNGGNGNTASATLDVSEPNPAIKILKQVSASASGPWTSFAAIEAGADVYYQLTIENTGDVELSSISVADPDVSTASCAWTDPLPVASPSNDNHISTCVIGPITALTGSNPNTATASGTYTAPDPDVTVTTTSTATYATPGLTVTKNVSPTYFTQAGDILTYSYSVRNTGSASLLGPVTLADDKVTGETCAAVNTVGDNDNYLDPNEEVTCTANTYTVLTGDVTAGSVTNIASAAAGGSTSPDASKTVYLAAMTIDKDTTTANISSNGTVSYSIIVKNTGQMDLTNFQITDDLPFTPGQYSVNSVSVSVDTGTINENTSYDGSSDTNLLTGTNNFVTGATATITINLQLNNATDGTYDNTVTASTTQLTIDDDGSITDDPGTPGTGVDPESDEDITVLATGTLIIINDSIPNDPQDFAYTVNGTGLTPFTLDDDGGSDSTYSASTTFSGLSAGGSYTVSESTVGGWGLTNISCTGVTNSTVTIGTDTIFDPGDTSLDVVLAAGETVTCIFTNTKQSLLIAKSVAESSFTTAGDVLHYSFVVTNNGTAGLAGPVTIADDKSTDETCPNVNTVGNNDNILNAGESITCTATYTVTTGDVTTGSVTNTASATVNGVTSNTDSRTVNVSSGIQVVKSPSVTTINSGGSVTYTYTVTNTGGAPLTSITAADDKCSPITYQSGDANTNVTLETTETWIYQCTTTLTSTTTNIVTVNGTNPSSQTVQDTDTAIVSVVSSGIAKNINGTSETFTTGNDVAIGEIVTYEITINLPAGAAFTNVKVTDQMDKGLAFVDCVLVNVAGTDMTNTLCPPTVTSITDPGDQPTNPANAGRQVEFNIGNISAPVSASTLVIQYRTIALDVIENQENTTLNNDVTWTWTGGSLSASAPNVRIVEPDMGIDKSASPTVVQADQLITFTLYIYHTPQSSADAFDVVVTDVLPNGLTYVACSLSYSGLAPDVNKRPSDPCNLGTSTLSFGWDSFPLTQTSTITFQARFNGTQQQVTNTAFVAWTSLPLDPSGGVPVQRSIYNTRSTERAYDPGDPANAYQVSDSISIGLGSADTLPDGGFAPNQITKLSKQTLEKQLTSTDLWLEIPRLGIKTDIVGVPFVDGQWDISWLGNQAGWLNGTAFPSWQGNSVIAGHLYLSNGKPGAFADLTKLKWDDKIIVHAYGSKYTYTVQEIKIISPNDISVLKHEEKSWVTLLTCKTFDEKTQTYLNRVAVRAILTSIELDK